VPGGIYPTTVLPEDRKLAYPFFAIELVQDKFEKVKNQDQIARVEDRFTGTAFNFRIGLASSGLGSDRDALLINAGAQTSFYRSRSSSLMFETQFAGRQEATGLKNASLNLDLKYYKRHSEKRLFYAALSGTLGHELDMDQVPYLGGDNGLRGYPLRYQTGEKMALLTLEQRFFTDWYPFRLFPVGAAIFFDAGKVWGENPLGVANDGVLRDVGVGLRLGNPRSGHGNVVHIDVAYPLDGPRDLSNVQFIVEAKQSF
jgi:hemolysin activation/secretion protein